MRARLLLLTIVGARTFGAASALTWNSLPGLKTTYAVMTSAPDSNPSVVKGDTVTVHATGIVKETNKKFWSTKDPGQEPFT